MRKSLKTIAAASALIAGLTTASVLYAQEGPSGTMGGTPGGMMGGNFGAMMGGAPGGMMGGNADGMMGMMGQMDRMAQNCNKTMASQGMAPNAQWNSGPQPVPPEGEQQGE